VKSSKRFIVIAALTVMLGAATSFFALGRPGNGSQQPAAAGQNSPPALENQLRELLEPVGVGVASAFPAFNTATSITKVNARWESNGGKSTSIAAEAVGRLTVTESRAGFGALPRQRTAELAETQVLVAGVDQSSQLVWWQVITDPRFVRSETVAATGEVSGRVTYLARADFFLSFPDDPAIKQLRLYHPQWNGTRFQLVAIGVIDVP
jgi:hypothetical protein